jgi:ring-1,2-phenylacetyl-CoA epoxidase subunit PaaC
VNIEALKELLYKMADDLLILGHRSSEWIGLGPLLEEDIAFASKAQDKVGQSLALYELLEELGEKDPDTIAFSRDAINFHNSQFVELPNGEFDFSIIRHFLFDHADAIRYQLLADSSVEPLRNLAGKFKGELQYHTMHADEWMNQLGNADDATVARMQAALDEALPYALGIFEPSPYEEALIAEGIFKGEAAIRSKWEDKIRSIVANTSLILADFDTITPVYGGRSGKHTEHLQPLLDEMGEVIQSDPNAEW